VDFFEVASSPFVSLRCIPLLFFFTFQTSSHHSPLWTSLGWSFAFENIW